MFCPKCAKEVDETDDFCRACAHPLARQAAPVVAPVATAVAPTAGKKSDKLLGVRIVLLIGAAVSAFTMPWLVTAVLGFVWIITLVLPSD